MPEVRMTTIELIILLLAAVGWAAFGPAAINAYRERRIEDEIARKIKNRIYPYETDLDDLRYRVESRHPLLEEMLFKEYERQGVTTAKDEHISKRRQIAKRITDEWFNTNFFNAAGYKYAPNPFPQAFCTLVGYDGNTSEHIFAENIDGPWLTYDEAVAKGWIVEAANKAKSEK